MDIKKQAVYEYLTLGFTYRQLASKYGVSRSQLTHECWFTRAFMIYHAANGKILTTFRNETRQKINTKTSCHFGC